MFQTLCFWARWHVTVRRRWCGPHSKWPTHANLDTCVTVSWLLFCGQCNGLRRYILCTCKSTPMISVLFLLLRSDCDVAACTHVHTHDKQHVLTAHVISCRPARNIANVECIGPSCFLQTIARPSILNRDVFPKILLIWTHTHTLSLMSGSYYRSCVVGVQIHYRIGLWSNILVKQTCLEHVVDCILHWSK